jgi:peptide-methionine (S)-S-oxide reductase
MFGKSKTGTLEPDAALPGREEPVKVPPHHSVSGHPMQSPYPEGYLQLLLGMGCFWGAERKFWQMPGVYLTAVGYAGGYTSNPTYEEVCSGNTGHAEVVRVVYDPDKCELAALLEVFWESHNPTQGMRQGNDLGTQYRSVIYTSEPQQYKAAIESLQIYQDALRNAGYPAEITTEIAEAPTFYFAEPYHQQYLAKNPSGYCGLGGLNVKYPRALAGDTA